MNRPNREILSPVDDSYVWDRCTTNLARQRRLRCLIAGDHRGPLPAIDGVDYIFEPEDDFDVIVALDIHDLTTLEQFITQSRNPAAPLAAFSELLTPRIDAVIGDSTAAALALAIAKIEPLAVRVSALPRLPVGIDRNGLLALALAYTRNCTIEGRWQPGSREMIGYPLLLGVSNARTILEELADAGLLRRRFFERLHVCQHCESSQLHAREVCVSCHSSYLAEHSLIHHYACGFQAAQTAFEHQDGYVCPKCHKHLRHYGVDYDKPGVVIACQACGKTMSEPQVGFTCASCGSYTLSDHAQRRDWYHYDLLPDGIAALQARSLPRTTLIEPSHGHSLRDFRLIVGNSLSVARRYERALTAWRLTIDTNELEQEIGRPGVLEVCQLVREVIEQNIRQSDVIAALPTGAVACLSETDLIGAEAVLQRVRKQIVRVVRPPIDPRIEMFEGDGIDALLQDLT